LTAAIGIYCREKFSHAVVASTNADSVNESSSLRHSDVIVTSLGGRKCRVLVGGRRVSVDRVQLLHKV